MFLEIFLHCLSTCLCQLSFSSTVKPRNSLYATLSIVCSSITISVFESIWFNLFLEPIIMYSVFLTFSVSLFDISHLLTFSRSVLSFCSISTNESPWQELFVSSANIEAFVDVKQFGKSLIYTSKSNGPRFDPCGTPQVILAVFDISLLILQTCFLPER